MAASSTTRARSWGCRSAPDVGLLTDSAWNSAGLTTAGRARAQRSSAPTALWGALVLVGVPRVYLVVSGDSVGSHVVPLGLLLLLGYFLIARRSAIAWWLFMVSLLVAIYLNVSEGVYDVYFAFVVSCATGAVVCLSLPQSRAWVGAP
jgi:hypothetical protein